MERRGRDRDAGCQEKAKTIQVVSRAAWRYSCRPCGGHIHKDDCEESRIQPIHRSVCNQGWDSRMSEKSKVAAERVCRLWLDLRRQAEAWAVADPAPEIAKGNPDVA